MIRLTALLCALATPVVAESPFPLAIGGPYALTNQHGQPHSQVDPDGRAQLLFFGYANCQQICSAALPMMADIADIVAEAGHDVTPVMITVDPARDTVDEIGPPLTYFHDDFVGLTGTPEELQVAYDAFGVEVELLFEDPFEGDIFAHGSFIYLLDKDGNLLTLIPPVVSNDQARDIVLPYLEGSS
jgi:protein SCO1/2